MSKNSNNYEITGEVNPYQITDRTLSFIPNLEPSPMHHFKELITGKIKITLYDFSKGKGDNGIYTYFNLDLKQFRYIYTRAKLFHLPLPCNYSKIHCQTVEKEGPYAGYCKSFRFFLSRNDTYTDKRTGEKKAMNFPWYIKITNGYALPGEDGKGEQKGTFKETSVAFINLSDEDFLDRMMAIDTYIAEYTHLIAQQTLATNLKKLEEVANRGSYEPNLSSSTGSASVPSEDNSNKATKSLPPTPELHTMAVQIISDFQALEDSYVARCRIGAKDYRLHTKSVTKELNEARISGVTFYARLYSVSKDGNATLWFYDIAA